jgi:hypothetical protein
MDRVVDMPPEAAVENDCCDNPWDVAQRPEDVMLTMKAERKADIVDGSVYLKMARD